MHVTLAMHGPNVQQRVAGFGSGRIWKQLDLEVVGFGFESDRIVKWRNCAVCSEHNPNGPPYSSLLAASVTSSAMMEII